MIVRLFGIFLVFIASVSSYAAENKPFVFKKEDAMRFALVRLAKTGCEPDCPLWISAEGVIAPGTAAAFAAFIGKTAKNYPGVLPPVVLSSPGGSVEDAVEMGRLIHKRGLDTAVGSTLFSGCAPADKTCKPDPARKGLYAGTLTHWAVGCASACPLVFAGGKRRVAARESGLGIHAIITQTQKYQQYYRMTYKMKNGKKVVIKKEVVKTRKVGKPQAAEKLGGKMRERIAALLRTSGVKVELIDAIQAVPHTGMRWLKPAEAFHYNLITELESPEALTQPCNAPNRPAACFKASGDLAAALVAPIKPVVRKPDAKSEMAFQRVRLGGAGCEPLCPEWIQADGWIAKDTPSKFSNFMKKNKGGGLPLLIRSYGGEMAAAIEMGKAVRAADIDVALGATRNSYCTTPGKDCDKGKPVRLGGVDSASGVCLGACTAVFAGGKTRLKGYMANISMQRMQPERKGAPPGFFLVTGNVIAETQENLQMLREHMKAMGVDPSIVDKGLDPEETLSVDTVRGLQLDSLKDSRLLTSQEDPMTLADASNCKSEHPPANCIRR